MPPSIHADEDETAPLVGVAQAAPKAQAPSDAALAARTRKEEYLKSLQLIERVPPAPFPWWRRLPFLGPTRDCVAVGQQLFPEQIDMLRKSRMPGYWKKLALDRELVTFCLDDYSSKNPEKYEPAPGKVIKHYRFDEGICLCHGNFVARLKCSDWLSFLLSFLLPVRRTLFFFEISSRGGDSREVVTCTPLAEPVTESYSVLGFPLGFSKRRSGKLDTICRTCSQRFYHSGLGILMKCPLCNNNVRKVCEMCYNRSIVLHPIDFKFGNPGRSDPK